MLSALQCDIFKQRRTGLFLFPCCFHCLISKFQNTHRQSNSLTLYAPRLCCWFTFYSHEMIDYLAIIDVSFKHFCYGFTKSVIIPFTVDILNLKVQHLTCFSREYSNINK